MAGGIGPFQGAGPPVAGVNEVQTLTFGGTGAGSTFKLIFKNATTAAITWSATNTTLRDNVSAALQALTTIGTGGVSVVVGSMASGIGTLLVTFLGANAQTDVPMLGPTQITLALTLLASETTKGVSGTARGASGGATYIDTLNGNQYVNDGTNNAPVWAMTGLRQAKVALGATDAAAGVLSWLNPEPVKIFVTRLIVDVTTKSTGACTVDFGAAATAISSDTLLDGLNVGAATGTFDNYVNHGTNGVSMVPVGVGEYVTGTKASGAAAGLIGSVYIQYVRA